MAVRDHRELKRNRKEFRKMMYHHGQKLEDVIEEDDFKEGDFKESRRVRAARKEQERLDRGGVHVAKHNYD
jgi:hypothetical protein